MAMTPSSMVAIGTPAPSFALPNHNPKATPPAEIVSRDDLANAQALLVAFLCNHCPFVKHVRGALTQLARDAQIRGVAVVGINANDVANYPDDSPDKMIEEAIDAGYTFPYLFDASQTVARAYGATCTPDFFLYDRNKKLYYRGQMDSSRPNDGSAATGESLREAIDALLAGKPSPQSQEPSIGCNIKWKAGNGPA